MTSRHLAPFLANINTNSDKIEAALNFRRITEWLKSNEKQFLDDYDAENILWSLVDPFETGFWLSKDEVAKTIEFIEWLIASGQTPEEFSKSCER